MKMHRWGLVSSLFFIWGVRNKSNYWSMKEKIWLEYLSEDTVWMGSSKLKMHVHPVSMFFFPQLCTTSSASKASAGQRVNLIFLSLRLKRANPENSWSGWVEIDTTDEVTFGFWNGKPGLAFSDICLATEMHLEGRKKKRNKCGGV